MDTTDPREELRLLASAARAWFEWQLDSGVEALPVAEGSAAELLASFERRPAPRNQAQRAVPRAAAPATLPAQPRETASPRPPLSPSPNLGGEERRTHLATLAQTVKECTRCGLHAGRKQTVFARGNPQAELCFIGEGPGADEDAQGEPFVGKAGQLLDKMILAMGLSRDEVYVANIVKCRPPNNRTPEAAEMASCIPYLNEQLDVVRPKVIVALGSTAVRGLLGPVEGITKIRGTWRLYRGATPLMPTFHPAYVLRQPTKEIRGMVWSDLQQVMKELGRPLRT